MQIPSFEQLMRYRTHIAILAIVICVFTWITELAGWVYVCPYCRTQRTVIGLLGLLLLANPQHWLNRWIASSLAVLGLVVAAMQRFNGWKKSCQANSPGVNIGIPTHGYCPVLRYSSSPASYSFCGAGGRFQNDGWFSPASLISAIF